MQLFIALGQSGHPILNSLLTEQEVSELAQKPDGSKYTFIPIELPWRRIRWRRAGGRGHSAYPTGTKTTTIKVPKEFAHEVQQYAVWLAFESLRK